MRALIAILCGAALWAQAPSSSSVQWAAIRGVNYIPSYGRNLYEIWRDYNHAAFDTELSLGEHVGYNSVRIWLNYFAYAEDPRRFLAGLADAAELCRRASSACCLRSLR